MPSTPQPVYHDDRNWANEPRPTLRDPKTTGLQRRRGARSLTDMAIAVLLENLAVTPEGALDNIPSHVQRKIWARFEARGVTFNGWKLLRRGLVSQIEESDSPRMPLGLFRFWTWIHEPMSPLSVYTAPLTSPSCSFITHLAIDHNPAFQADELLALAKMTNLGVLEIMDGHSGDGNSQISDRLIRGWSETPGAFPSLRVLRIQIKHGLTRHCVRYASQLPSLAVFEVTLRDFSLPTHRQHVLDLGWRVEKTSSATDIIDTLRAMKCYSAGARGRWDFDFSSKPETSYVLYDPSDDIHLEHGLHMIYSNDDEFVTLSPRSTTPGDQTWPPLEGRLPKSDPEDKWMIHRELFFGSWAFWLYAAVGLQNSNEDLLRQVPSLDHVCRLHDIEVSPLPIVCVGLGTRPLILYGAPAPNYLFIRSSKKDVGEEPNPGPSPDEAKSLPRKKRRIVFKVN